MDTRDMSSSAPEVQEPGASRSHDAEERCASVARGPVHSPSLSDSTTLAQESQDGECDLPTHGTRESILMSDEEMDQMERDFLTGEEDDRARAAARQQLRKYEHPRQLSARSMRLDDMSTQQSVSDTAPLVQEPQDGEPSSPVQETKPSAVSLPPTSANVVQKSAPVHDEKANRITLPTIERWEDLSCIRFLDRFYAKGGVDERGYQILYRMCQLIWAIGHEVEIRKKTKLQRTQRLAKFQQYCDALLQGAKLWQKNMKAQMGHVCEVTVALPRLQRYEAAQDLEPRLNEWYEARKTLYLPGLDDAELFARILRHYGRNYKVLYALHREKPDYGLRDVLPKADKVYKVLMKLPEYALTADELIIAFETHFWRTVDRYYEDRARQEKEVAEFEAMSFDEKLVGFKHYMRYFQRDFIPNVNTASDLMSQMIFNEHVEDFKTEFLRRVGDMVKKDQWRVEEDDEDWVELRGLLRRFKQQRDAEDAKKGWAEALGLDIETLEDDDDDDPSVEENVPEDIMREIEGEPLPENSRLSHLLRAWKLHGIVPWDEAELQQLQDLPEFSSKEGNLNGQQQPTLATYAELPEVNAQGQSESSSEDQQEQSCIVEMAPDAEQPLQSGELDQTGITFAADQSGCNERKCKLPLHISNSFAAVEDDLALRGHQRSTTVPDIDYIASDNTEPNLPRPGASFHGRAIGTRRHGVHVPRIFTGSFSQLETDIRKMQLHKVMTPEDQPDLLQAHDFKIRDFAVTPQISPSATATPSPTTLLFRREALLSKETELQHRVINGEMISSRRPSTKIRAQTVDETTGGLEAWLATDKARGDSPTLAVPSPPRPARKNTI